MHEVEVVGELGIRPLDAHYLTGNAMQTTERMRSSEDLDKNWIQCITQNWKSEGYLPESLTFQI
jgi:hypothetical protein